MSRLSNSEKYIICLNFKGYNQDSSNLMLRNFEANNLSIPISSQFLKELSELNELYTQEQMKSIQKGIQLIENNQLCEFPTHHQIKTGEDWCRKNHISLNPFFMYK